MRRIFPFPKADQAVLFAMLLAILAVPFLLAPRHAAEGPGEETAPEPGDVRRTLRILSPHSEGIRREFSWSFGRWHRERFGEGVTCDWVDVGGTGNIMRYIESRFTQSPDGIDVDLMFGGGVEPYLMLKERGWLEAYEPPREVLDLVPPTLSGMEVYDPELQWFGVTLVGFGIIYNRRVCDFLNLPEVKVWGDLGKVEYLDWIASGDPRLSGSVHMVYEIILQAYGWEKGWEVLTRMAANARMFTKSSSDVPRNVAVGEVAAGMCIDSYAWATVADVGAERIGFSLPSDLTVINPDSIGILRGAPDRELAERSIEFVLSEECQCLWLLPKGSPGGAREFNIYRMSIRPDLYEKYADRAVVRVNPFQWENSFMFDPDRSSARYSLLKDLIGAALIENHPELVRAWKHLIKAGREDSGIARLAEPMITEEEALRLGREVWAPGTEEEEAERQKARSTLRANWAQEYRERYILTARGNAP